jgi:hypothetical protein
MFDSFKDTLDKVAAAVPTTVYVRPLQYNTTEPDTQVIFCSDGPGLGQATLLIDGKPMIGVKRLDYCFGHDGRPGKGYLAIEQFVSWFYDMSLLTSSLEKQGIEVVFVPSTSLRKDENKV